MISGGWDRGLFSVAWGRGREGEIGSDLVGVGYSGGAGAEEIGLLRS